METKAVSFLKETFGYSDVMGQQVQMQVFFWTLRSESRVMVKYWSSLTLGILDRLGSYFGSTTYAV